MSGFLATHSHKSSLLYEPLVECLESIEKETEALIALKVTPFALALLKEWVQGSLALDQAVISLHALAWLVQKKTHLWLPIPDEPIPDDFEEEVPLWKADPAQFDAFKGLVDGLRMQERRLLLCYPRQANESIPMDAPQLDLAPLNELAALFQKMSLRIQEMVIVKESHLTLKDACITLLGQLQSQDHLEVEKIFLEASSKKELIVLFLAILELMKLEKIKLKINGNKTYIFPVLSKAND